MTHTDEKPPRCDKCEKNFCTECLFSSPYEDTQPEKKYINLINVAKQSQNQQALLFI